MSLNILTMCKPIANVLSVCKILLFTFIFTILQVPTQASNGSVHSPIRSGRHN